MISTQGFQPDRDMSPKRFEAHCLRLPAATKVVQWDGTSVFKVGRKMFALARGFVARSGGGFMFKTSNMAFATPSPTPNSPPISTRPMLSLSRS
jgi:hypothetical protein